MQTNKFARAALDRGIGEQISSEEALKTNRSGGRGGIGAHDAQQRQRRHVHVQLLPLLLRGIPASSRKSATPSCLRLRASGSRSTSMSAMAVAYARTDATSAPSPQNEVAEIDFG